MSATSSHPTLVLPLSPHPFLCPRKMLVITLLYSVPIKRACVCGSTIASVDVMIHVREHSGVGIYVLVMLTSRF